MAKPTQSIDPEWDALLAKAAEDESKLKTRLTGVGSSKFFLRQCCKALFVLASPLLLLLFLSTIIWTGDTYLVRFNASDWANRRDYGWQGRRLWNRFEHQHRVIRPEVIKLLGLPGWRDSTTFVYSLGGVGDLSPKVWLSFSKDKVTWYEIYYSDFSFTD
jgi:hypothetical protein